MSLRVGQRDPLVRMRHVTYWLRDQVCVHTDRDLGDEGLVLAAREQTNAWLDALGAGDRAAWVQAEGWKPKALVPPTTLYGTLALRFRAAAEDQRHAVMVCATHDDSVTLGVVKGESHGQQNDEDYVLYNPMTGALARYGDLSALCDNPLLKSLHGSCDLYWVGSTTTTITAVHVKSEPVPVAPVSITAPVRAKKPPAGVATGKKRGATSSVVPTSPLKKAVPEGAVALIEESSGETAK